ncbi:MAG: hypothetical protein COC19_08160 [SAR86 cluster bacterium]|uniref:Uncharacterized protein n=1 Tax=SAR86 cluster bacterium TaxID=2030880 RepID=A0A2A4MFP3_9GAMM|nr:MAG: hypothetical protein COC19_08160 [SAR86 cluster bacterium]
MYIPRPILILLTSIYLLILLSTDWVSQPEGPWYRPFIVGLLIIIIAAWTHRERDSDEL